MKRFADVVEVYFPRDKRMAKISGGQFIKKSKEETSKEFVDRTKKLQDELRIHERNLFGPKMKKTGLKCPTCAWLQWSEDIIERGNINPYCWLYGEYRVIGTSTSSKEERAIAFGDLTCIGETDYEWIAKRIKKVPGRARGRYERYNWFKKNFPKGFKKLGKAEKDTLRLQRFKEPAITGLEEETKKLAMKEFEQVKASVLKKFKNVAKKIPPEELVRFRMKMIDDIKKIRKVVLGKIDKLLREYSREYDRWSGKPLYWNKLTQILSLDLQDLLNLWIAAKTVRTGGGLRTVKGLFGRIKEATVRFGTTTHLDPLKSLKTPKQVAEYSGFMALGIFDYKDFTLKTARKLRAYNRRHKVKVFKTKLPDVLADKIYKAVQSVEPFKKLMRKIPKISQDLSDALSMKNDKLLKAIDVEKTIKNRIRKGLEGKIVWKKKLSLSEKIATLNALYVKYAEPLKDILQSEMVTEARNFDDKYMVRYYEYTPLTRRIGVGYRVPTHPDQMFKYNKKSIHRVLDMTKETLQEHHDDLVEDVRATPRYMRFLKDTLNAATELEFGLHDDLGIFNVDVVPYSEPRRTYRMLSLSDKAQAYDDAVDNLARIKKEFKRRGIKPGDKLQCGILADEIKKVRSMSYIEKCEALRLIEEKQRWKRKKAAKKKKKAKPKKEVKKKPVKRVKKRKAKRYERTEHEVTRLLSKRSGLNVKVVISYDLSGDVISIWDVETKRLEGEKWRAFKSVRKREKKFARTLFKRTLQDIEDRGKSIGVKIIAVEPSYLERIMFESVGYMPITDKIKKRILKISDFDKVHLERVKLYKEAK